MVDVVRFLLRFRLFWLLFAGNRNESQQRIQCGSTPEGGRALRVNARGVAQDVSMCVLAAIKNMSASPAASHSVLAAIKNMSAISPQEHMNNGTNNATRSRTTQHCASLT